MFEIIETDFNSLTIKTLKLSAVTPFTCVVCKEIDYEKKILNSCDTAVNKKVNYDVKNLFHKYSNLLCNEKIYFLTGCMLKISYLRI